MTRHETQRLWDLATNQLELEDRRFVQLHLQDCPECREGYEAVQIARQALGTARAQVLVLDWQRTDAKVGGLVEKRMRAATRPRWFSAAAGLGLVGATAALAVWLWPAAVVEAPPTQPPLVRLGEPQPVRVELARGLSMVSAKGEAVGAGETLRAGDVVKTAAAGKAFVHLPDESLLRVGSATQLALTRVDDDDVALNLMRGRLAVRASHQVRKGFVVHARDVAVRVVGTVFSVENERDTVQIAVAEGEVKVSAGDAAPVSVLAGQRLVIDTRTGRARTLPLTGVEARELAEVQGLGDAASVAEQQAAVAAKGGVVRNGALPRLSQAEAKARQAEPVEPKVMVAAQPEPQVEVPNGPGTVFPSLAGGYTRVEPMVVPAPTAAPAQPSDSEWASAPVALAPVTVQPVAVEVAKPAEPAGSARLSEHDDEAPVNAAPAKVGARSLEQLFLERAQASVEKGTCERYLVGLEDLALDQGDSAQLARVLRARCFDAQLRPRQATAEYLKYLQVFPKGRFVDEARAAVGQ